MTDADSHIDILLSTHNGSKYLDDFIQSLMDQDYPTWSLMVRDDGSSDSTADIIREWQARAPGRVVVIDNPGGNVGVVRSYSMLLKVTKADYIMFADQDDIWLPEKLRLTMGAMRRQERESRPGQPILVHTDLMIVDDDLRIVAKSSWDFQGLAPGRGRPFRRIMVENIVWGCTAMLNRPLVDRVGEIPVDAGHHDWWIALVAAAFGDIVSLKDSRILWRRHGLNVSEVSDVRNLPIGGVADIVAARKKLSRVLAENRVRIRLFLDRYRGSLDHQDILAAEAFLRLPRRTFFGRRLDMLRYGLFFGSSRRNLGMFALI